MNEIAGEILSAINDELKAVKRNGGTSRMTLFSGKRSSNRVIPGSFVYRFDMLLQRSLPDGSRGQLTFHNRREDAEVVATEGQYLWLSLKTDLGDRLPQAYYDVDMTFLLEDLKEKYSSVTKGELKVGKPGKNLLLGNASGIIAKNFYASYTNRYLSSEQILAIEKMLSSETGYILGPPGTGKTMTLAGALVECFMNEEKILICGFTNRAVDEALAAFKKAALTCMEDSFLAAYKAGRILRKGTSVFAETEPIIKSPEEMAEGTKATLLRELDEVRGKLKDIEKRLDEMRRQLMDIEQRDRIRPELSSLAEAVRNETAKYEENDRNIGLLDKQMREKESEKASLEKSGILTWVTTIKRRGELSREIGDLKRRSEVLKAQQPRLVHSLSGKKEKLRHLEGRFSDLQSRTGNVDSIELKRKIEAETDELQRLKRLADDIKRATLDISGVIMERALVVFATLSRSHLDKDLGKIYFDRVFIDEASMASLPQVFLAGFKAKKSICIFGDPKQLAPICLSSKDNVRKWFARDIYQYTHLDDASQPNVSQLLTQRRMPSELGSLVSHLFYSGKLMHDYDYRNELPSIFPWLRGRRVTIVDTTSQGAFCNRHESGRGYSRINVSHAVTALSMFREALELGIDSNKMAYITPYRAQAEFFGNLVIKNREMVEKDGEDFLPDIRWGTVHRFQGGEAELVIYDTCESPRQQPTKLTGGNADIDVDDPEIDDSSRLHCVALSRAKSHLLILANLAWLRNTLSPGCKLTSIIKTVSEMGCVLPVPEKHSVLKMFDNFQSDLFTQIDNLSYVLCNEAKFYDLFTRDLDACRKTAVIVSPFLTTRRITLLESTLRELKAKKVKTVVWTKDPLDLGTTAEAHEQCSEMLKKLGLKVIFRSGTHEKAVILDGEIAYYGSLNPLSQRDTRETMLRVKDEAFARALIDHLGLDESESKQKTEKQSPKSLKVRVFKRIGIKETDATIDKEKAKKALKKLRWVIAEDKGLPVQSILWNRTIDWLLDNRPTTKKALLHCEEFTRNRSNIAGYEEIVIEVIARTSES